MIGPMGESTHVLKSPTTPVAGVYKTDKYSSCAWKLESRFESATHGGGSTNMASLSRLKMEANHKQALFNVSLPVARCESCSQSNVESVQ